MRTDEGRREATSLAIRAQTRAARRAREIAANAARRVQWGRWTALVAVWQVVSWTAALILTTMIGFTWIGFGFFVIVFSVTCLGLFTQVIVRPGWLLERQVRAGDDVALAIGHLPARLGRLVEETRMLRLAIEASAPGEPTIDGLVWAWVSAVRELGPLETEMIGRLGISHSDVVEVLLASVQNEPEGPPRVASAQDPVAALRRRELLAEHLEAFEVTLLRYDPSPYR